MKGNDALVIFQCESQQQLQNLVIPYIWEIYANHWEHNSFLFSHGRNFNNTQHHLLLIYIQRVQRKVVVVVPCLCLLIYMLCKMSLQDLYIDLVQMYIAQYQYCKKQKFCWEFAKNKCLYETFCSNINWHFPLWTCHEQNDLLTSYVYFIIFYSPKDIHFWGRHIFKYFLLLHTVYIGPVFFVNKI